MPYFTEGKYAGEFLASEANGQQSRDTIILAQQVAPALTLLAAGTILGVVTATGKAVPVAPAANDGSQTASKILYANVDASAGDVLVTVISRDVEVNGAEITYPVGATAAQILAINAQLLAARIIVRAGSV